MLFTLYNSRKIFLILGDSLLLIAWILAAIYITNDVASLKNNLQLNITIAVLVAGIFQVLFYFHNLYNLKSFLPKTKLAIRLASSITIAITLLTLIWWLFPTIIFIQSSWLLSILIIGICLYFWHIWIIKTRNFLQYSVLIIGTGEMAISIAREILSTPSLRIKVCGFLSTDKAMVGKSLFNPSVIGTLDNLETLVIDHKVDRILVASQDRRGSLPVKTLLKLKFSGIEVEEGASFLERAFGKLPVQELSPSYLVFSSGFKISKTKQLYKNIFSIVLSTTGLILAIPIIVLTAIAIKLDSAGPVFFSQERVGKDGRIFKLIKFRSMKIDAEATTGPVWAQVDDPRITRVGRFIRLTRIDEIPQFINVLKGDMHLVGPRPERLHFTKQLQEVLPYYTQRHSVKPGITGWAQVKYPYGATTEEAGEKLKYDLYYIKNLSILLDLWIVLQTVKIVLLGRGSR